MPLISHRAEALPPPLAKTRACCWPVLVLGRLVESWVKGCWHNKWVDLWGIGVSYKDFVICFEALYRKEDSSYENDRNMDTECVVVCLSFFVLFCHLLFCLCLWLSFCLPFCLFVHLCVCDNVSLLVLTSYLSMSVCLCQCLCVHDISVFVWHLVLVCRSVCVSVCIWYFTICLTPCLSISVCLTPCFSP